MDTYIKNYNKEENCTQCIQHMFLTAALTGDRCLDLKLEDGICRASFLAQTYISDDPRYKS